MIEFGYLSSENVKFIGLSEELIYFFSISSNYLRYT